MTAERSRRRATGVRWCALAATVALGCLAPAMAQDLPGWEIVWRDEFDGPTVDNQKWEVLTRRDSFNNEKQFYTPPQASIVDGNLRITATNQPLQGKQYRSARLESWGEWSYGRFEARADLPT